MTIAVANVDTTADTFSQWVVKTNIIADALSNKIVTVNSNTATGNAAITGTFSSSIFAGNTISGGNSSVSANLTISTNTAFTGAKVKLGLGANVQIDTGNSTYRVLTVNSTSNTLVATILTSSDISDMLKVYYANGTQAYP